MLYWPSSRSINTARVRFDQMLKVNKLFIMGLFCFCRPVICLWALQENNALEVANQSVHFISDNYWPDNKNAYSFICSLISLLIHLLIYLFIYLFIIYVPFTQCRIKVQLSLRLTWSQPSPCFWAFQFPMATWELLSLSCFAMIAAWTCKHISQMTTILAWHGKC